jgi:8-oxo-dGTP diphosphatase
MLRTDIEHLVASISPFDTPEESDRTETLAWLRSDGPIFRTQKPATPPAHLVAYFVVVDVDQRSMLLVDHINAQRWLPTGGHVEPDEHPNDTVIRELREELGIAAPLVDGLSSNPLLVTRSVTGGLDYGHTDVSLWYVVAATTTTELTPDPAEFNGVRWWTFAEIRDAAPDTLDPNLARFVTKLERELRG